MVPMGVRIGGRGRIAGKQGVGKGPRLTRPARLHRTSFSRHSEVQRIRKSTLHLFIRCSLARGEARLGVPGLGG